MTDYSVEMTEDARKHLYNLIQENFPNSEINVFLRFYVSGGGCAGLSYGLALDTEKEEDDITFVYDGLEHDGVTIMVDPVSIKYVNGSTIELVDTGMGAAFKVNNPNATGCGCGKSFQSKDGDDASGSCGTGGCCGGCST